MATSLPEFSLQGKIAVITGGARYVNSYVSITVDLILMLFGYAE
jgi:hypothetical protein